MNKLYKLKNWYSVDAAAKRLTQTLGEDVSSKDILQISVEGHLPLSWYIRGRSAQVVAPVTRLRKIEHSTSDFTQPETSASSTKAGYVGVLGLQRQSNEVISLEGPFRIEMQMMDHVRDWVLSFITDTGGDRICLEGFLVRDQEDNLWQMMDLLTSDDLKEAKDYLIGAIKKHQPEDKSLEEKLQTKSDNNRESYYPSGDFPEYSELGYQRVDLENFEKQLNKQASNEQAEAKPLNTKERDTLLKMIISMAVDGYGYDPLAAKSPIPTQLCDILAELGIELDVDTIRNKLKEAAKFYIREGNADKTELGVTKPKSAKTG